MKLSYRKWAHSISSNFSKLDRETNLAFSLYRKFSFFVLIPLDFLFVVMFFWERGKEGGEGCWDTLQAFHFPLHSNISQRHFQQLSEEKQNRKCHQFSSVSLSVGKYGEKRGRKIFWTLYVRVAYSLSPLSAKLTSLLGSSRLSPPPPPLPPFPASAFTLHLHAAMNRQFKCIWFTVPSLSLDILTIFPR